ncbi:MAG: lysophospholipid acyltransferase family protein [Rickettsiales bacterium]
MLWCRSLIFNLCFWAWTIGLGLLALPLLLMGSALSKEHIPSLWVNGVLMLLKRICRIDYVVEGDVPDRAVVYASKHQSAFETLAFWKILNKPAFILKRELLWIPVFGWYLALTRPIAIDRGAGAAALKQVIRECGEKLAHGQSVVIFPEGTRTRPGEQKPYQPGIAAIYAMQSPTVVPIALNSGRFWSKNSFIKRPGTVHIQILNAMPAQMEKKEFLTHLQEAIEQASASL